MTSKQPLIISVLFVLVHLTSAFISEKEIVSPLLVDTPAVDCQIQRLTFEIETRQPFSGRLFVKGHSNNKACSVDFFGDGPGAKSNETRKARIAIDYNTCGVERIRSVSRMVMLRASSTRVSFSCLPRASHTQIPSRYSFTALSSRKATRVFECDVSTLSSRKRSLLTSMSGK